MPVNNGDSSVRVRQFVMVTPTLIDESGLFQPLYEFVCCHENIYTHYAHVGQEHPSLSPTASIPNVATGPLEAGGWRCPLDP